MLQAYALQKVLIELKYDTYILNYDCKKISKLYKQFRPISKNPFKTVYHFINDILEYNKNKERILSFEKMRKKMNITERFDDVNYLNSQKFDESIFITGSDQVWNFDITGGLDDIYFLNFGSDKIKRISYAASIGKNSIPSNIKADFITKVSKISKISIREESGKKLINELLPEMNVNIVLDPTLLLTKNEWLNELPPENFSEEKYILAYVVAKNEEYVKIVNELSKITGLKVIHFEKTNNYDNVLKSVYTEGPLEFVNLIKNAEYVVTTSFHATAFSIIFNKKFWVVPHKTTGSRVTDLLNKLDISNRAVTTLDEFKNKNYDEEIDYNKVNKLLEIERKKSIDWLINAIEK